MKEIKHHHRYHHKCKIKWWFWVIIAIIAIYLINGAVFAVIIYKKYPNTLSQGKKYPDQQKVTCFMTKVYPFAAVWVNSDPIWVKDYYKQLGFVRHFSEKTQQQLPSNSELEKQVLEQMIDTKLISEQAKKNKIAVTKKEIDDTYNKLVQENQGEKQVSEILNELYGMTEKDFKALIYDQLLRQKIQENLFVQVKARHIVIKDEGKAKEVLETAKKGEKSFEDLAKEFSEDLQSRDNGGDLGWFGRNAMVKDFEDVAFSTKPGTINENLTKTEFGYHIIKVEEKKGQLDQSYLDWFKDLKAKAKIKVWIKTEPAPEKEQNKISPSPTVASPSASPTETKN